MTPEHKQKLAEARARAREARVNAVDAELTESRNYESPPPDGLDEVSALKAELAALKEKTREKAAHEYETISGREKLFNQDVSGVQGDVKEALRTLLREELAETFPERQPVRRTARESMRPNAVVATGRDGQPLYRKRDFIADQFSIPDDLQEPGWSYQWCRTSTLGQEDVSHMVSLQENGWRHVPASRPSWRGRFMPENYEGPIYRDGLVLMERPASLTEEAQREASKLVKQQSQAQRQQFGMALPQGFSANTPQARAHTFARSGKVEATPDSLRPTHSIGSIDID